MDESLLQIDAQQILVQRLSAEAKLPQRMTAHAAGFDLWACLTDGTSPIVLSPGCRALIPTGIAVAIPPGFEGQIRARSGLTIKYGLVVGNAPGTIDADFRGEVRIILFNLGQEAVHIHHHERIAQLVIARVSTLSMQEVSHLPTTVRGEKGFGSTGIH